MELVLRVATEHDVAVLAQLNAQLIRDEGHRNTMTLSELEARMAIWLAGEYSAVIFEQRSETVGYMLFKIEANWVYLRHMFVKPTWRRQGVGSDAMQWLAAQMKAKTPRIRIEVLSHNPSAVAFWRSVGFSDYAITMEKALV